MKANENNKLKVIFFINKYLKEFQGTTYESDLKALRKKYIYKDISDGEIEKDVLFLKRIKMLLYINKY